ncbi:DUF899 domain-containing protein [Kibdelosporangium phytohabitans]|uniref:Thioredoxin n=1 Tax=Kibdelosporangium phytohabitans TaxID=860235 RepID=A0A0N9IBE1_9PSEU|nr:DUF899 domain-containing protein [Kibdelosporangium phytohabitans]ALG12153.1 thioredoxin [Kibdelosporangium phytohabitans]MBE1463676.1 putative dithiol-disulfide oxidoreductase (DUF899 family) [Kibdelosporangium phytohabitans]
MPRIGTREEWLIASRTLLEREKEHSRAGDRLAALRRELPWVPVTKQYTFATDNGPETLADLFDGRTQLLVKHFMFAPDADEGCPSCSLTADHFDGAMPHLNNRDVTLIGISRAPLDKLNAYKRRMGWDFTWVSSFDSDFNYDYGVSFTPEQQANGATYNFRTVPRPAADLPGMSAFAFHDGTIHHTYSSYARGADAMISAYQLLDRTPHGRDEDDLAYPMAWVRRHDDYTP